MKANTIIMISSLLIAISSISAEEAQSIQPDILDDAAQINQENINQENIQKDTIIPLDKMQDKSTNENSINLDNKNLDNKNALLAASTSAKNSNAQNAQNTTQANIPGNIKNAEDQQGNIKNNNSQNNDNANFAMQGYNVDDENIDFLEQDNSYKYAYNNYYIYHVKPNIFFAKRGQNIYTLIAKSSNKKFYIEFSNNIKKMRSMYSEYIRQAMKIDKVVDHLASAMQLMGIYRTYSKQDARYIIKLNYKKEQHNLETIRQVIDIAMNNNIDVMISKRNYEHWNKKRREIMMGIGVFKKKKNTQITRSKKVNNAPNDKNSNNINNTSNTENKNNKTDNNKEDSLKDNKNTDNKNSDNIKQEQKDNSSQNQVQDAQEEKKGIHYQDRVNSLYFRDAKILDISKIPLNNEIAITLNKVEVEMIDTGYVNESGKVGRVVQTSYVYNASNTKGSFECSFKVFHKVSKRGINRSQIAILDPDDACSD